MNTVQIVYLPVGVPTFHLQSAREQFRASEELLKSIWPKIIAPEDLLLSVEALEEFVRDLHPDLVIFQNATFANAAYATAICAAFDCPILLWTLREPVIDGGRLRLNSLTGAYSAGNSIREFQRMAPEYVFGGPKEESVARKISAVAAAVCVKKQMEGMKLAMVGHTPEGFGFGRALDLEMRRVFGVSLETVEARELMELAASFTGEEAAEELREAGKHMRGLEQIPEKYQMDFARLYRAYRKYIKDHKIQALASRCWPDFFTAFGTPVCGVLAMLNDLGVACSCEADAGGALSMYLGMQLSGGAVFFGDPVSLDETENTLTFWHCGTAACSLAREDTGAQVGVHCNRRIGPTMDFGCRSGEEVTVFRIGRNPQGTFRFFLAAGEALERPKQFEGTSVVVRMSSEVKSLVERSVCDGWEPHFVVIYKDVREELEILARMLGLEICRY